MRSIKFRAWSHHWKKMFVVTHLDISSSEVMTGYVDFEGNEGDIWDAIFDGKDFTLMQFTGMLDKDGKRIYEGDIVSYKEKMDEHGDVQELIAWVQYNSVACAFGIGRSEIWNFFNDFGLTDIKVIGNIYENKELLK